MEGIVADARHALRNRYLCQFGTVLETIASNRLHALGQGDGGQLQTGIEGIFADARHAIFYDNGKNFRPLGIPRGHRRIAVTLHLSAAGNGQSSIPGKHPGQILPLGTASAGDDHVPVLSKEVEGRLGGFLGGFGGHNGFLGGSRGLRNLGGRLRLGGRRGFLRRSRFRDRRLSGGNLHDRGLCFHLHRFRGRLGFLDFLGKHRGHQLKR